MNDSILKSQNCSRSRFLLIGLNGLNWSLVRSHSEKGNLPQIQKMMDVGVSGKLAGISPITSAPLWASIATGVRPEHHGIFVDGFGTSLSLGTQQRNPKWHVPAIWDILESNGMRGHVVGWPASGEIKSKNGGIRVSDAFASKAQMSDTTKEDIRKLVSPPAYWEEFKELQWHPDEFTGNDLCPFIPDVANINLQEDDQPWRLAQFLSQAVSINAAATYALQDDWDFACVFLPGLDAILNAFLKYESPRLTGISLEDHHRYQYVIPESLRLYDQMIGVLASIAGKNGTVVLVSPFGYRVEEERFAEVKNKHLLHLEHRIYPGYLMFRGDGFKSDEWVFGTHILDILPTLLAANQLKQPGYLKGKILAQAFRQTPDVLPGENPCSLLLRTSTEFPHQLPGDSDEAFDTDELQQLDNACRQSYYLFSGGHFEQALVLLKKISHLQPYRLRPFLEQIQCLYHLGRFKEALELLEEQEEKPLGGLRKREEADPRFLPQFDLMKALLLAHLKRHRAALRSLEKVQKTELDLNEYAALMGDVYLSLKQWKKAEQSYLRSLANWTNDARSFMGLAKARYRLRKFQDVVDACLNALTLEPSILDGHLVMGLSLAHLGKKREAIVALNNSLRLNPHQRQAHRVLSHLYGTMQNQGALAQIHRTLASQVMSHH